jgi:hypothetical protein
MQDFPVPLVGPSNNVDRFNDPQRSINLFPRKVEREGEKSHWRLVSAPGLASFASVGHTPIRGRYVYNGRLFVVAGAYVLEVYANGTTRQWGTVPSLTGRVYMAELLHVIVIGDGTGFYGLDLDAGTLTKITQAPIGAVCISFNQTILYQERGSGRVHYSDLNDAFSVPDLNFFTAENRPDDLVTMLATEDQIWLLGQDSTEVFYDTGDADTRFVRVPGSAVFNGCAAAETAVHTDNSIIWVGTNDDGAALVLRNSGFNHVIVSTRSVEKFLKDATGLSAYSYQEDGSTFYVLNADQGTWALDVSTQEWAERAWLNQNTGQLERARAELHAFVFGKHLVTDYATDAIYEQSTDIFDNAGVPLVRRRVFRGPYANGAPVICDQLFIDMETGVGLDGTGQGTDPVCMLRYSDDGGEDWSNEIHRAIGKIGKRKDQVIFNGLGLSRNRVFELSVSDPVPVTLIGAQVRGRVGRR